MSKKEIRLYWTLPYYWRSPLIQDLEAIINSLAVEEDDSWADLAGVGVVITLITTMDMPMAMAKAAITHKEVKDI